MSLILLLFQNPCYLCFMSSAQLSSRGSYQCFSEEGKERNFACHLLGPFGNVWRQFCCHKPGDKGVTIF